MTPDPVRRPTLRAEQVAQTRAALIAAGRDLFGASGFAATSVDELAARARVTTGALYHHFPTKAALFEAVFEDAHRALLQQAEDAGSRTDDVIELLSLGFEGFLDAVTQPELQRIIIIDAPAVLGLARFTELDERHAFPILVEALRAAAAQGRLSLDDPETLARLLLGTLARAAMLIASSADPATTRDEVAHTIRGLLHAIAR